MTQVFFIRHGESVANANGTLAGQLNVPLTEKGRQQAELAGEQISRSNQKFDLIVSSPLERAYKTAEAIASKLNYPIGQIAINYDLIERNFGDLQAGPHPDWSNINEAELVAKHAEPVESMEDRARNVFNFIAAHPNQSILLVSHNVFGRKLIVIASGQDEVPVHPPIPNAELLPLTITDRTA